MKAIGEKRYTHCQAGSAGEENVRGNLERNLDPAGIAKTAVSCACRSEGGEDVMAFRVNYNQQRSDRQRAKEQKKQEKLQRREDDAARRRAERALTAPPETPVDDPQHD